VHGGQVDLVLHDLQAGADVAVDARGEQGEHRLVVAEFRNIAQDHLVDILGNRADLAADRRRDARHQPSDRGTTYVHLRSLTHSGKLGQRPAMPLATDPRAFSLSERTVVPA
jgi:hypothetical protein